MRRLGLAVLVPLFALAGALAAVVVAGPGGASLLATTVTVTTPTTSTEPVPPLPGSRVIADGVTVGSIAVGGLTGPAALAAVRQAFFKPLVVRVERRLFRPKPGRLGATAPVRTAVRRALSAAPGARIPLAARVDVAAVRRYVARLARRFDGAPVDAHYVLRNSRAIVIGDRPGRRLERVVAVRAIVASLRAQRRPTIRVRVQTVRPRVTRRTVGAAIVIRRSSNHLAFFVGGGLLRTFGVATGQSRYPTPLGSFSLVVKWRNPWWYPPNSDWARGASPIPPGPGNPLGTRWMGLSVSGVGIHGTPDGASIGYSVSHGCIRMRIPDAEWLFARVPLGTPVFIIPG